jgi:steroid 5-alpha reductase family enzyme
VFELVFISVVQNGLLLLLALPAWAVLERGSPPLRALDVVAAVAFLGFLAGETVADEQQWRFQRAKAARRARGEAVDAEFVTTGLFRYSRHPNFFCEQGLWWSFHVFAVAAGATWLGVTIAGPLLLTLLFQGSTSLTESLSLAKYPAYAAYQRTTSRLVPWRPRRGLMP